MKLKRGKQVEEVKVTFMQKRGKQGIKIMAVIRKKLKAKSKKIKYKLIT